MKKDIIPNGWTRGAAIQYRTQEAIAANAAAFIVPYHNTPEGSAQSLKFKTVEEAEAWRHWWFSGPLIDPAINFQQKHYEDMAAFRMVKAGTSAPVAKTPQPKLSPFDKPKPVPDNPFSKPANPFATKPFNPFAK